jgi:hypothetical protein
VARLDSQQRRILELLSETEWRSTEAVFAATSVYRSVSALGGALGQLAGRGLAERRERGHRGSEWRRPPDVERGPS